MTTGLLVAIVHHCGHREHRAALRQARTVASIHASPQDGSLALSSMATATFDLRTLLQAVDEERRSQGLSWSALSAYVGVSASTIRRFGVADDAEADGVLAMVRWLGVAPEDFVRGGAVRGHRLPTESAGFVRVDMGAVARAAG